MVEVSGYDSAANRASDLLYEVAAWLEDLVEGECSVDDAYAALIGRLGPAGDAALAELRQLRRQLVDVEQAINGLDVVPAGRIRAALGIQTAAGRGAAREREIGHG